MATTIRDTGMSCDGCEDIVEGALEDVDGVESAEADQHDNTATVEGDVDVDDLVEAVDTAGYEGSPGADGEDSEEEDEAEETEEVDDEETEE
jgi:copper chaperone